MTIELHHPSSVPDGRSHPPATIPALGALLDELLARGVRFCCWKSNEHLGAALAGDTDVDLLVDRRDAPALREVLARGDVKPLVPPSGAAHAGMEHYLGLDPASGRQFHLHVHSLLVLGERYVKNYRLPLEEPFLESVRLLDGVPVPAPALELSVLVLRVLLKYRARDIVKDVLKVRHPGIKDEFRTELAWLRAQTTTHEVRAALHECGDVIPPDLVVDFLDTIDRDLRDGRALWRLRTRARRAVAPYQRRGRIAATAGILASLWHHRTRFRLHPLERRMTPAGGGFTLAIVGPDGAGKSTLTTGLTDWLGWKLATDLHYLGSKQPSRRSRALYRTFRILRRGHTETTARLGRAAPPVAVPLAAARDVVLAFHHLSILRDRSRRVREGTRQAQDGHVVVFDRFPFEAVSADPAHRLLDGPGIAAALAGRTKGPTRGVVAALARSEERRYREFRLPDRLVVLQVSPNVAADRKPDHPPELIATKQRAIGELARLAETGGHTVAVTRIDADRPLDTVRHDLETRVWHVL